MTLCLDSADWPCADHMHSPKKKTNLSSNTHQIEHVHVTTGYVCIRWSFQQEEGQRIKDQTVFLHNAED
ncbi:unnamed protein product [Staurois parvus]|uniref:Uncharacterized protein n=1 Tax=Staurois parvus TaxID=386267 RepID=A0ABN9GND8_9NEOB|nr:unnamed protein product [Staurois parvus]